MTLTLSTIAALSGLGMLLSGLTGININYALRRLDFNEESLRDDITSVEVKWTTDSGERRIAGAYFIEKTDSSSMVFSVASLDDPVCRRENVSENKRRRIAIFDGDYFDMMIWCARGPSNQYTIWLQAATEEGNKMLISKFMDPKKDEVICKFHNGYDATIPNSQFKNFF